LSAAALQAIMQAPHAGELDINATTTGAGSAAAPTCKI
jgi:hypothetical protein